ncbi:MAG: DUF4363 family protein [Clostridia bacterium]|nr:DUF4363 family protein [Clostridia bacterium]
MHKELIISIVIVISIFALNYITQNYTDKTVIEVKEYLEKVKEELIKEEPNFKEAIIKADKAFEKWEELDDKLALYIEHDEIEKVTTAITSTVSFTKMKDEGQAVDSIDRCKYLLDHIDEREKFALDNIF